MHRYSSVAAFLAHYESLRKIPPSSRTEEDRNRLEAIAQLLKLLRPEEREAFISDSEAPLAVRHRERASRRLHRELISRGALDN